MALGVVLVLGAAGFAFLAYTSTEYSACYGSFESRESAERAADAADQAGYDADVEDGATGDVEVTFTSGETEEDARGFRDTFQRIVEQEGGTIEHDRNGCVERPPIEGL